MMLTIDPNALADHQLDCLAAECHQLGMVPLAVLVRLLADCVYSLLLMLMNIGSICW